MANPEPLRSPSGRSSLYLTLVGSSRPSVGRGGLILAVGNTLPARRAPGSISQGSLAGAPSPAGAQLVAAGALCPRWTGVPGHCIRPPSATPFGNVASQRSAGASSGRECPAPWGRRRRRGALGSPEGEGGTGPFHHCGREVDGCVCESGQVFRVPPPSDRPPEAAGLPVPRPAGRFFLLNQRVNRNCGVCVSGSGPLSSALA